MVIIYTSQHSSNYGLLDALFHDDRLMLREAFDRGRNRAYLLLGCLNIHLDFLNLAAHVILSGLYENYVVVPCRWCDIALTVPYGTPSAELLRQFEMLIRAQILLPSVTMLNFFPLFQNIAALLSKHRSCDWHGAIGRWMI